jgi:hypothetical protein
VSGYGAHFVKQRGPPPARRKLIWQRFIRRGKKRTIVAVGHTMLLIAYHLLKRSRPYQELGPDYFDRLDGRALKKRLVKNLAGLGYEVTLRPLAAPSPDMSPQTE